MHLFDPSTGKPFETFIIVNFNDFLFISFFSVWFFVEGEQALTYSSFRLLSLSL